MNKPQKLIKGDKVAIVSLSSGLLGEPSATYQVNLGIQRLKEFGLEVEFMPNALKGIEFIKNNPQARAKDLKQAFKDNSIKGIICAIGGLDTYKTFPYLLNDQEFIEIVKNNPKLFMGFSDTTNNHFMFQKLGLNTFYGPAFIVDFAEAAKEMLSYTHQAFEWMFENKKTLEIKSSPIWYSERTDFSQNALGVERTSHEEKHGYEVLRGAGIVTGKLLGGCLDSIYEMLSGRFDDQAKIIKDFGIFPNLQDWTNKIAFLETSEEKPNLVKFTKMVEKLKDFGIFNVAKAIIVGKPQDEVYYEEYKQIWLEQTKDSQIPILYNINFGHAYPRTIIPYGIEAKINFDKKQLFINEPIFAE